jgi:signal transduction histidine kinase
MARMSADLLGLARGDAGAPLDVGEINWDAFVAEIGHDASRICGPRRVTVFDAPQLLGTGTGDEAALRRAFRVLFDNVARHTPPSAEVQLRAVASGSGDEIRISVSDTGPGVDRDDLPRIFDRFFRADPSRQGRGAGLGLAIARSVIERHTGELTARNRQPHGLIVEARLPREQEAAAALEPGQLITP